MKFTRREMALTTAASAAALPLLSAARVVAQTQDRRLLTLSDGHLSLPANLVFAPVMDRELAPILAQRGVSDITAPLEPPCNVSLLETADRLILFDVGAGTGFQPTVGHLPDALSAAGYAPDDVTDVVFTHAHPDHLWGLLDDFDEPVFLNAQHWIGAGELDYWMDPDTVTTIGDARASFAVGAARRLQAISDRLAPFAEGQEILPGVLAHLTPGHTPGHMAFEIAIGTSTAMVIGDAIGNDHIALARPDWPTGADQDESLGARTRARLVERLSSEHMLVAGFHLSGTGLGRIDRSGDGFTFVEEA